MNSKNSHPTTVGEYLLARLCTLGTKHIFGIPGDYVLRFNQLIEQHPHIQFINTTRENSAGFSANAYAHLKGLGVACVTYGVGIEIISALAQAYIENYPLVIISGAIAEREYKKNKKCHHLMNKVATEHGDCTQLEIFKNLTIDHGLLHFPSTAAAVIDRVLHSCLEHKKPVYFELPRDMVDQPLLHLPTISSTSTSSTTPIPDLDKVLNETQRILSNCHYPLIWAGHEILRFNLNSPLLRFAEKYNIPLVSSLLGKTVIDEHHPLFIGVYQGEMSSDKTLETVKKCDCLLIAGVIFNDIDTGIFTTKLDHKHQIVVNHDSLTIDHHHYSLSLVDYINGLNNLTISQSFSLPYASRHETVIKKFSAVSETKTTMKRVFECLQTHLTSEHIVVSDVGDSLFASSDLVLAQNSFLSNPYFTSIGTGIPTAIGAQFADPSRRVVAIVGDGGFQMSAMELSTAVRYHLDPIVIVLNNHGYGTERVLLEGDFNDIVNWNYTQIPLVLGGGVGIKVATEEAFQQALEKAFSQRNTFYIIEVDLDKTDFSPSLTRLGETLGKIVKSEN